MAAEPTLLIVDDDPSNLRSYAHGFARQPYRVLTAAGGREAIDVLRREPVDVLLTDLKMPDVDGLEVVAAAAALPMPPVTIVITAYGTIESAVEAMRRGASDYITKPVELLELRAKVEKAAELRALRVRNEQMETLLNERFKFEGVVGVSKEMQELIQQARTVAVSRASVLIEGESGTGKELIARAIHFNSPRASAPFVPIHCASLPESLLESELFGHEKGSFTGASERRIGQFESAQGGTVFLDELSEIPLGTQVKLLRVLEQREITRVGASRPIAIDIRLVGATNKDLAREVKERRFREDLYYRLNVVRLTLPPLRSRKADIPPLVDYFLKILSRENQRPAPALSAAALNRLMAHPWPGNIRELRNTIEQIVVFAQSDTVGPQDLPSHVLSATADSGQWTEGKGETAAGETATDRSDAGDATLAELEKRQILAVLQEMNDNRTHAARRLGISRRTLQRKLKELGLI